MNEPMRPLEFVMFHSWSRHDSEAELRITQAARSFKAHYPEARITLLTNDVGSQARLPGWIGIRIGEVDPTCIMFERARLYADFLRGAVPGAIVAFLDTDMLAVRRFDELFAVGADVTVTVRQILNIPINGGLIIADTTRHTLVVDFFDRLVTEMAQMDEARKKWDGDQLALQTLLNAPVKRLVDIEIVRRGELVVRLAPVNVFNNTPRSWFLRLRAFRPGARLLHFKGWRKRLMTSYARLYLSKPYLRYATWMDGREGGD